MTEVYAGLSKPVAPVSDDAGMRRLRDPVLTEIVLHDAVPAERRAVLSQSAVQLDEAASAFVAQHLERGMQDKSGKAAALRAGVPAGDEIGRLLTGQVDLLAASQVIAQELVEAIPTGLERSTLAFCRFTATGGDDAEFFALLKLDPNGAYRTEQTTDEDGNTVLRLVAQENVLPTPQQRLQKSVFAAPPGYETEHHVLLLDRQTRPAAAYWVDFLGAQEEVDDAESTKRFVATVRSFARDHADQLGPEGRLRLDKALTGAVSQERVDAGAFAQNAVEEELAQSLREAFDAKLPDHEFTVDGGGDRAAPLLTFKGSNGLRVRVDGEHFNDMVNADLQPDGTYLVTITTATWEQA